jgi:hypothetical protein
MFDSMIRNLQADIALLQRFIEMRQATGLADMQRIVEALSIRIFHVTRALLSIDLVN